MKRITVDKDALFRQAVVFNRQGRLDEAIPLYRQFIDINPAHFDALYLLGGALLQSGRFADGIKMLDRALALKPEHAGAHNDRGYALACLKRFREAVASYDNAIGLNPASAPTYQGRGDAYAALARFEDALTDYEKAIALKPDYVEAHINRGNTLKELGRITDAMGCYAQAITLDPANIDASFNQGLCLLLTGQLAQGWALYEWRKKRGAAFGARNFAQPVWTGAENIAGKRIFIYCEQGLGDTIQFCRYIPLLQAQGARVVMAAPRVLQPLLQSLSSDLKIIDEENMPENFDCHQSVMSLPLCFGTTLETIPAPAAYLRAASGVETFLPDSAPKIGVVWGGRPTHQDDARRSIPLRIFAGLFAAPGVKFYSFNRDMREGDVDLLARYPVENLAPCLSDFKVAAQLINQMDLIITCDSAPAHLAGALGKPVWVLLPFAPDWRWLTDREDSPWYPSMRLFRQKRRGDWAGVIGDVKAALQQLDQSKFLALKGNNVSLRSI